MKLNKRFTSGFSFTTHYTLARTYFHDGDYFPLDSSVEYGPDDFQPTHVFVLGGSYTLPFGQDRRWASGRLQSC